MKKLFWVLLLSTSFTFAQSSKKYPSLLWKITGKDQKKPSYLYGTMHVSNRVAYYLSEQFFDALKSVEVVGLETNPGEWLENMKKTGELDELTQVREPSYGRNFYKSAFAVSFPEKRVFQSILSYDPDIINGLLYRQNNSRENFEESTYIDLFIYQSASKLGKKVISLEDFATSEIKARLSALPDDNREQGLRKYSSYGSAQKIEDAYREGNLDVLDSLSRLNASKNTQKYLIDDRNVFFVNTIDSVMRTGTIFSGVGAAHLPGEMGVIELLRKKGYKVEPIEPKVSRKSNQEREELDQMVKPVEFTTQYAEDSLFSVDLPGKMYSILDAGQLKYKIHADMVNGSFYTIVRLKHLGPVFGVSATQVYARVDSLLFEHIPGRILNKKEISASGGIKGLEIVNRTRRGDEQHYQIFFTEQEMILFKLGGKSNYASGEEAGKFFNSIKFRVPRPGLKEFSPPSGGFTVQIPGDYFYENHSSVGLTGLAEDLFAFENGRVYGVKHAVYNDFDYLEVDSFELFQLGKNVLENYAYSRSQRLVLLNNKKFPALSLSGINSNGQWLHGNIIIKGVHYYLLYSTSPDSVPPQKFLNSFGLGDFVHVHPIKEITDKDFYFSALDEVSDDARSRFNEKYIKAYEEMKPRDSTESIADFESGNKLYYSPSSKEYISISYERFSKYDYRDVSKIAQRIEESYLKHSTLFITRKKFKNENGIREYRFTLGDTATVRAIETRVLFRNSTMHELTVSYDTTIGLQGWTKQFFESFLPIDSAAGKSIFESGFAELAADLVSNDTIKRKSAGRALAEGMAMQEAFAPDFIKLLNSPALKNVSEDSKAQLFVNGGTMGNEGIIAPYRKLYLQYTDSFYLQLCLLKGLAYMKTPAACKAFSELIIKEPPLVGDENSINDVFLVFRDSLELCRHFFPQLLTLTRYEEFRNPVYALMADLVEKKLLNAQKYAKQKDVIVTDASLALKRYNPAARAESSDNNFSHLDKAARELAETIRKSLDGLTNNILYRGSDHEKALRSQSRPVLVTYASILAPFYARDEKVREFFSRLARTRSQDILLPVTIELLRYNITLNDSIIKAYSSNITTRAFFYSELEKNGLAAKFDKDYLSQEKLVKSLILSHRQLNSYYGYEKDLQAGDSLALVKIENAENKYQKGKLYIYSDGGRAGEEKWMAVFVPENNREVTSNMEVLTSSYFVDLKKSTEENINELLSYFRLSYRKRALLNATS